MRAAESLDRVRDELLAMSPESLVPMNVDPVASAMMVLGVVPELQQYRAALSELCGEARARHLDRLPTLAQATLLAHAQLAAESGPSLEVLGAEVKKARRILWAEAHALAARDVIPEGLLGEVGGRGHRGRALDVLQLVAVFETTWPVVERESRVTKEELARAELAATELVRAIGERNQAAQTAAAELRHRAFSLLASTYEEARRMVAYLRWHEGDADRIAPSFWSLKHGSGRKRRAAEQE